MDTTSTRLVAPAFAAVGSVVPAIETGARIPHSSAVMLQRTTTAGLRDAVPFAGYPVDHAALHQQAREMRSAYIATVAARWMRALRRTFRQDDRQARFIWP